HRSLGRCESRRDGNKAEERRQGTSWLFAFAKFAHFHRDNAALTRYNKCLITERAVTTVCNRPRARQRSDPMIIVPGQSGKDLCDPQLGVTRRDVLRVGGSGLLGLSLGSMLE